jgi:hypothetical protein
MTGEVSLNGNFCLAKLRCAGEVAAGAGAAATQFQRKGSAMMRDEKDMLLAT